MLIDAKLISLPISILSRDQDRSHTRKTISCETVSEIDIRSISARIDRSKFARAMTLLRSDSGSSGRSQTGGLGL